MQHWVDPTKQTTDKGRLQRPTRYTSITKSPILIRKASRWNTLGQSFWHFLRVLAYLRVTRISVKVYSTKWNQCFEIWTQREVNQDRPMLKPLVSGRTHSAKAIGKKILTPAP
ncbi:hypothetical protein O3G_MSEX000383 [Manduca sexta]|nr:hypothetical protein O3G_MSEX000383 [Manduca sexta]